MSPLLRGLAAPAAPPALRPRPIGSRPESQRNVPPHAERGQAIPLVALVLPLLISVIGLAIDGGVVFDARRELQNVADTAAHAGAGEIDLPYFRATGSLALDARAAVAVAGQHIADYNALHRPEQRVELEDAALAGRDGLVVQVSRAARPAFLRIVGITSVRVTAEAAGTARSGGG